MTRELLTLSGGISFSDDISALACLLDEIGKRAERSGGEILVGEIQEAAAGLGYRGTVLPVIRLLVDRGFLSETERGRKYRLDEEHQSAITRFFAEHEPVLSGVLLSEGERTALFGNPTPGGTETDILTMKVMQALSLLLGELSALDSVESRLRAATAEAEASRLIAIERLKWVTESASNAFDKARSLESPKAFGDEARFSESVARFNILYELLCSADESIAVHEEAIRALAREKGQLLMLGFLRGFLDRVARVFLSQEEGEG